MRLEYLLSRGASIRSPDKKDVADWLAAISADLEIGHTGRDSRCSQFRQDAGKRALTYWEKETYKRKKSEADVVEMSAQTRIKRKF